MSEDARCWIAFEWIDCMDVARLPRRGHAKPTGSSTGRFPRSRDHVVSLTVAFLLPWVVLAVLIEQAVLVTKKCEARSTQGSDGKDHENGTHKGTCAKVRPWTRKRPQKSGKKSFHIHKVK